MKKRKLKLDLKKEVISKLEMQHLTGGNLPGSHYTSPSLVAACTWTVGNCNPAPVPTCDSACPTYIGNSTCPCDNTVNCTVPITGKPCTSS
jgi:hypothetical protein